jgi:hypothetical protein
MLFMQGMDALEKMGCNAYLEIGPQSVLIKTGRRCVQNDVASYEWLMSIQPGHDEVESILPREPRARRRLRRPSELNPTPRPWRAPMLRPLIGARREAGDTVVSESSAVNGSGLAMELFSQHCVFGQVVLPGASHILLAVVVQLQRRAGNYAEVLDAGFERPFIVPEDGVKVQVRAFADRWRSRASPRVVLALCTPVSAARARWAPSTRPRRA